MHGHMHVACMRLQLREAGGIGGGSACYMHAWVYACMHGPSVAEVQAASEGDRRSVAQAHLNSLATPLDLPPKHYPRAKPQYTAADDSLPVAFEARRDEFSPCPGNRLAELSEFAADALETYAAQPGAPQSRPPLATPGE